MLGVDEVEFSVGLEGDERAAGPRRADAGEVDRPGSVRRQPGQRLDLEGVGAGPPPEPVDVGGDEPVEGGGGGGAEEDDGAGHGALEDDVRGGGGHEGDDGAQGDGEAAGGEGEELHFLYRRRYRPVVDEVCVLDVFAKVWGFWSDGDLGVVFSGVWRWSLGGPSSR